MTTGQTLKAEGIDAVLAADCSVTRDYAALVREAVEWHGPLTFTAEDVRAMVEVANPDAQPHSPNVLPAVLGSLASAGRIEAVGHTRCTRSSRRHGWMRVWRLTPSAPSPAPEVEGPGGGEAITPAPPAPRATPSP